MKEEEGLVIAVHQGNGMATIKVGRHDECTACGACAGSQQLTVEAVNSLRAEPGQRVRFQMQEKPVLWGAFIVFVMPLLLAAACGVAGWHLGKATVIGASSLSVCFAAMGFMGGAMFIKWFDRRLSARQQEQPVITEIMS